METKQRFCCTKHRVYFNREGLGIDITTKKPKSEADTDTTIAAALRSAEAFTPVPIADTKTVAAIRVQRHRADPATWEVFMPSSSALAASRIFEALHEHIGDLLTLANKLGQPAGEPLLVISTRKRGQR